MKSLTQSRYNVVVPLTKGRALVHNTMSNATVLLEAKELTILRYPDQRNSANWDSHIRDLIYGGFVIPQGFDELKAVQREFTRQRMDSSGMILTIAPTLSCNFGCDYCFQGIDKPAGKMTVEVQEAVLEFIKGYSATLKRLHVAWYGGEPLLALGVIESLSDRLIEMCRIQNIAYDAMIVTNGYKLDGGVAKSLCSRSVRFAQVTLDGAAEYHDCRRTTLGGKGTFDRIINNLYQVVELTGLRIDVRINIDSRNAHQIFGLLNELAARGFAKRKTFSVYFAPVEAVTEGCHSVSDSCLPKSEYAELETALHRHAYELGLASLPYPRRFRGLCSAIRPRGFVVTPTGDVHKCWDTVSMPHLRVGTIFECESLEKDLRTRRWIQWTPFENRACVECKLLPSCAGSCAHKFLNPDQTRGEAASLPCPPWKHQINERLVMFALKRGMICSEDFTPEEVATKPYEICPHVEPVPRPRGFLSSNLVQITLPSPGVQNAVHC